jgi:hypothetical protein
VLHPREDERYQVEAQHHRERDRGGEARGRVKILDHPAMQTVRRRDERRRVDQQRCDRSNSGPDERHQEHREQDAGGGGRELAKIETVVAARQRPRQHEMNVRIVERVGEDALVEDQD